MHDTHVYLGPSLDIKTATSLLPEAHYHPPIQCGDIIRLLRLDPKKIIIIDGLYEVVPAVWHKEILIAMDLGIEVWGAGSMGALRAAELYQYGMKGFGAIFNDFKSGRLNDDDEVAVLHRGKEEEFSAINDAMVNIRATCELAHAQGVLSAEDKNTLVRHCKNQFYPYRSLNNAMKQLDEISSVNKDTFSAWFSAHGLVDIKKQDAMGVLAHNKNKALPIIPKNASISSHLTVFLRELIQYANVTPFEFEADWLPPIEKKLQGLYHTTPGQYMLVAELAYFTRKLFSLKSSTAQAKSTDEALAYIKNHGLFSPESDFANYAKTPELAAVYTLVCQSICMSHLTLKTVNLYLPVITHYYDVKPQVANQHHKTLRILLLLILSISSFSSKANVKVSEDVVISHCQEVIRRRNYSTDKFKLWFNPAQFERQLFINFLMNYMITLRGTYYRSKTIIHYQWIYDAYLFYAAEAQVLVDGNHIKSHANSCLI
ncbi:TfuA-like protein [bacterium]|nr:TfuA-like protein [bacterium]